MNPHDYAELVFKAASKYSASCSFQAGDLVSYGWFGLVDAANKYDPSKGEFEPYALRRIFGAMIDGVRKETETRKYTPEFVTLMETLPDDTDVLNTVSAHETARELREAVSRLPGRQRYVVKRYYFDGARQNDIARELCVTAARTSQVKAEALAAMRGLFSDAMPIP